MLIAYNIVTRFIEKERKIEIKADGNCLYNSVLVIIASRYPAKLNQVFPDKDLKDINYMSLRSKIKEALLSSPERERIESRYLDSMNENIFEDVTDILDEGNEKLKGYKANYSTLVKIQEEYKISSNHIEAQDKIAKIPFTNLISAYLDNIEKVGSFGGSVELSIMANLLGVNIIVKSKNGLGFSNFNTFKLQNDSNKIFKESSIRAKD